jgi:hypothetical protein
LGRRAILVLLLLSGVARAADIRTIEAVGSVPIREGQRGATGPKEAAIDAALREAVSRVARDFLIDADPDSRPTLRPAGQAGGEDPELAALRPVLGRKMVRYTKSFRILEDRGVRPALFGDSSGAATEYVVIVEVSVDAGKVEKRLVERGLLAGRGELAAAGIVQLEVLGLYQYAGLEQLRGLLLEDLGARSVAPLEFERGRGLLAVETELPPAELLHRLLARSPENMEFSPLGAVPGSIRLRVSWQPLPEPDLGAVAAPGRASSRPAGRR